MADVAFVVIDTETTGLDTSSVYLLEVGIVLADADLQVIDTFDTLVTHKGLLREMHRLEAVVDRTAADLDLLDKDEIENARWVVAQHKMSGLWDRALAGIERQILPDPAQVSKLALEFLAKHDALGKPMVGSNVANFDRPILRRMLPSLEKAFHYRNMDVSSLKTFAMAFEPEEYHRRRAALFPKELHRCVADCVDTLGELQMYREWLFEGSEYTA